MRPSLIREEKKTPPSGVLNFKASTSLGNRQEMEGLGLVGGGAGGTAASQK